MSKGKDSVPDSVIDKETAEEKLGPELIAEIAEKEWKTAPMPTEEELAKEKHSSPKARSHPNSRKNLMQYRKDKPKEAKKKVTESLTFKKTREEVNPFDYIKAGNDKFREVVKAFLPERIMMRNADEEKAFYTILNSYFMDFDTDELKSSDIEDIISLCINRIMENRLLVTSQEDPNMLIDISAAIQKYRQHSEKLKSHLAARRADRIDPRSKQNFSIVDLVNAYDEDKKKFFDSKLKDMRKEEDEYTEERKKRLEER